MAGIDHWEGMWEQQNIPWHRDTVDSILKKHLTSLTNNKKQASVLVTLCGKSLDLVWLCKQGHNVVGTEFSEIAGKQLFEEENIPYTVSQQGDFKVFVAQDRNLKFYAGDFLKLSRDIVGEFDAIWDHHALGAIDLNSRTSYINNLYSLLKPGGRILLSHFEYETKHDGAPYSLTPSLIKQLFEDHFDVKLLERIPPEDPFLQMAMKQLKIEGLHRPIHLLTKQQ